MPLGRLSPSVPVVMTSGEATPSQEMPKQFISGQQPASPLVSSRPLVTEFMPDIKRTPVVSRVERTVGMRYLYARGMQAMPIQRLGSSAVPRPNISAAQPNDMGPIHDAGFNDALYQAGYPGFNLGLSFKVQTLQTTNQPSSLMSPMQRLRGKAVKVQRASGRMKATQQ